MIFITWLTVLCWCLFICSWLYNSLVPSQYVDTNFQGCYKNTRGKHGHLLPLVLFVCFRSTCTDTNRLSLCLERDKVGVFWFICSAPHIFSPPTPSLAFIHAYTQRYLHTSRFQRISLSLGECDQCLGWNVYIFSITSHFRQSYHHRWVFLGRVLKHLSLSIEDIEITLVKVVLWRVGVHHAAINCCCLHSLAPFSEVEKWFS